MLCVGVGVGRTVLVGVVVVVDMSFLFCFRSSSLIEGPSLLAVLCPLLIHHSSALVMSVMHGQSRHCKSQSIVSMIVVIDLSLLYLSLPCVLCLLIIVDCSRPHAKQNRIEESQLPHAKLQALCYQLCP